jgi:Phytoene/squalene synthetase
MLALGKRYGMALQLINVLRDAGSDLRAGRCYFPEHELSAVHLTPRRSSPNRSGSSRSIERGWRTQRAGLTSGMEYSRAIKNRRVRAATVLPALIGARTLALLNASGPAALQRT